MNVVENISFTKEECENIIRYSNTLDNLKDRSFLGKYGLDSKNVRYDVWNISLNDETKWIFDRINQYFENYYGANIISSIEQIHLHKYNVGDKFSRHSDSQYPTQQINVGICLNDDYEGGEFILYNPEMVLPKIQGTIYTFPSRREHEVKEIIKGERWSIISFFHTYNFKIKVKSFI